MEGTNRTPSDIRAVGRQIRAAFIQSHVGVDGLGEFFRLLRLETHIGTSATTLRRRLNQMEALLPQFQAQCEQHAGDLTRPGMVF